MKCNGCGRGFTERDPGPGGVFSYGNASIGRGGATRDAVRADYHKTLCPRCARVLKSILLNSDLSEHWEQENLDETE